jgi:hypothetical protein
MTCLVYAPGEIWNRGGQGQGEMIGWGTSACYGLPWGLTHQAGCCNKMSIPGDPFIPVSTTWCANNSKCEQSIENDGAWERARLTADAGNINVEAGVSKPMLEAWGAEKATGIPSAGSYRIPGASDYEYSTCVYEHLGCEPKRYGHIYLSSREGKPALEEPRFSFSEVVPHDGLQFAYEAAKGNGAPEIVSNAAGGAQTTLTSGAIPMAAQPNLNDTLEQHRTGPLANELCPSTGTCQFWEESGGPGTVETVETIVGLGTQLGRPTTVTVE